jgi:hypothetical protein
MAVFFHLQDGGILNMADTVGSLKLKMAESLNMAVFENLQDGCTFNLFICNRYRCRICSFGCTTEIIPSIFGAAQVTESHLSCYLKVSNFTISNSKMF